MKQAKKAVMRKQKTERKKIRKRRKISEFIFIQNRSLHTSFNNLHIFQHTQYMICKYIQFVEEVELEDDDLLLPLWRSKRAHKLDQVRVLTDDNDRL